MPGVDDRTWPQQGLSPREVTREQVFTSPDDSRDEGTRKFLQSNAAARDRAKLGEAGEGGLGTGRELAWAQRRGIWVERASWAKAKPRGSAPCVQQDWSPASRQGWREGRLSRVCTWRVRVAAEGGGVLATTEHTADVRVWEVDGLNWRQGQRPPAAAAPRVGRIRQSDGCRDQGGWAQGRTAS